MKASKAQGWQGGSLRRFWPWLLLTVAMVGLSGCKPTSLEGDDRMADLRARELACQSALKDKDRVPIKGGGGYIVTSRFAYVPSFSETDGGDCATPGIAADFYWTGEKILPSDSKFTGLHQIHVPPEWRLLRVSVTLADRTLVKQCKEQFDPQKCWQYKPPETPLSWPEHLIVRPSSYPGLELWLEPNRDSRPTGISYFLVGWPRNADVGPPSVHCWALGDVVPVHTMSPAELEQFDFGDRDFPCDLEVTDFDFRGGRASIHVGTRDLKHIVGITKALQQYLSDSIIKED